MTDKLVETFDEKLDRMENRLRKLRRYHPNEVSVVLLVCSPDRDVQEVLATDLSRTAMAVGRVERYINRLIDESPMMYQETEILGAEK